MDDPTDTPFDSPVDRRFFEALKLACQNVDNVDQTCRDAIDRAVQTGDAVDRQNARNALNGLDVSTRDTLFRTVHMQMATDLSAIWDMYPGARSKGRPN